jgi:carbon-monoxide dehydrogenase medium subunit
MKSAAFDYAPGASAPDAAARLATAGAGAKLIAGGQSLGPMLNLRLVRPTTLIDISRAADMSGARDEGSAIVYGAAVTHAQIEDGAVPDATPGWLAAVARHIAYRAVRNRGTIGGSLAHADPAADWVNVLTALGASLDLIGGDGKKRVVRLPDFFLGPFETALAPDEVIAAVRVPKRGPNARWAYWKFCRKEGEFALASAAALIDPARSETRILVGAIERPPVFLDDPAAVVAGLRSVADAVRQAVAGLSDASFALHVAAVRRALAQLPVATATAS